MLKMHEQKFFKQNYKINNDEDISSEFSLARPSANTHTHNNRQIHAAKSMPLFLFSQFVLNVY